MPRALLCELPQMVEVKVIGYRAGADRYQVLVKMELQGGPCECPECEAVRGGGLAGRGH
jgi:hypothetical protein